MKLSKEHVKINFCNNDIKISNILKIGEVRTKNPSKFKKKEEKKKKKE